MTLCPCWKHTIEAVVLFFYTGGAESDQKPNDRFLQAFHPNEGLCPEERCNLVYLVIQDYVAAWKFGSEKNDVRPGFRAECIDHSQMKATDYAAIARWVEYQLYECRRVV